MNGHQFTTTVSNPDLLVAIHTKSHQIPFQKCWSVSVIYKLPSQTTSVTSLKLLPTFPPITTQPRSQYPLTPPHSTLASAALKNFASKSCILLLRKATVIWPKYSFLFRFISICLSNAHLQAGRCSRQSQVSAALSPFHIYLFPAFQGFPYYTQLVIDMWKRCEIIVMALLLFLLQQFIVFKF